MKKNIKSVSEIYICPKKAGNKFRSARKFHTPLYLYGVTGIGKTALILNNVNMKKCSYYSAATILADEINIEKKTTEHTVVIDDLQSLADSSQKEAYFEKIKELLGREDIWLILISRCPFPRWLLPLRAKYIFVEIEEEDFLFSLDEQIAYIEQFGLELPHEQHQEAWSIGGGNHCRCSFMSWKTVIWSGRLSVSGIIWRFMYMISGICSFRNFLWMFQS